MMSGWLKVLTKRRVQCMYMYNLDKDELICKSCPVYGTEPGKHTSSHPLAAVHMLYA